MANRTYIFKGNTIRQTMDLTICHVECELMDLRTGKIMEQHFYFFTNETDWKRDLESNAKFLGYRVSNVHDFWFDTETLDSYKLYKPQE